MDRQANLLEGEMVEHIDSFSGRCRVNEMKHTIKRLQGNKRKVIHNRCIKATGAWCTTDCNTPIWPAGESLPASPDWEMQRFHKKPAFTWFSAQVLHECVLFWLIEPHPPTADHHTVMSGSQSKTPIGWNGLSFPLLCTLLGVKLIPGSGPVAWTPSFNDAVATYFIKFLGHILSRATGACHSDDIPSLHPESRNVVSESFIIRCVLIWYLLQSLDHSQKH